MEITKRYYWIKLKTDFFNLAEIDFLLSHEGNCLKIAGFENMIGSETGWAKQKREQREKQKLLSGQCPPNSPIDFGTFL